MDPRSLSRRQFLLQAGGAGLLAAMQLCLPSYAWAQPASRNPRSRRPAGPYELSFDELPVRFDGRAGTAIALNGQIPGPLVRLQEGQEAVLRVNNRLSELASIHWHGVILPPNMDGVPGVSFGGIAPGTTFEYRFPVRQSGTYWYHSHSGGQEMQGVYAPIIIDPLTPDPYGYERDYVVMLSDWSFQHPMALLAKLKAQSDYFNFQRRTLCDLFADAQRAGWGEAIRDRLMWAQMRMDPTDLADITGAELLYLMNGQTPVGNWTGMFKPGERIRLRFIGAAAMTIFDVRLPGLKLKVVQVDGQNIRPVEVDEFRIAPGETFDVIVQPTKDQAYAVFAETIDRSGFALGTLAPRVGMKAPQPERRKRALRSMTDMGMADHGAHAGSNPAPSPSPSAGGHAGHGMAPSPSPADAHAGHGAAPSARAAVPHGPDHHGPANSMVPAESRSRLHEPGIGLGEDGRRVLVYGELRALKPNRDPRPPAREIELHLTGNMERFMWSIDGKKFSEAPEPIRLRLGERARITMVNDTMMEHPMHLHGMWMYLENGGGDHLPLLHTVLVKPAERLSVLVSPDVAGPWAFHCHLLLHMEMGMFRVFGVVDEEVRS